MNIITDLAVRWLRGRNWHVLEPGQPLPVVHVSASLDREHTVQQLRDDGWRVFPPPDLTPPRIGSVWAPMRSSAATRVVTGHENGRVFYTAGDAQVHLCSLSTWAKWVAQTRAEEDLLP